MVIRVGDSVTTGRRHAGTSNRTVHSEHAHPGARRPGEVTNAIGVPFLAQCPPSIQHGTVIWARDNRRMITNRAGDLP